MLQQKTNEIMTHYYSHMYNLPDNVCFLQFMPWEGLIWHCLNLQKYLCCANTYLTLEK